MAPQKEVVGGVERQDIFCCHERYYRKRVLCLITVIVMSHEVFSSKQSATQSRSSLFRFGVSATSYHIDN